MRPGGWTPHVALPAAAAAALLLAACGGKATMREAGVPMRLDVAARAIHDGEFEAAEEALIRVRETCGDEPLGHQALILLGAMTLDPRNPVRNPDLAATVLARAMRLPEAFPWTRPLSESLYLLALELGASVPDPWAMADALPDSSVTARVLPALHLDEESAARCQPGERNTTQAVVPGLPDLIAPNVPERLQEVADESATLRRQLAAARRELATRRQELAAQRKELDRVRATVRP